MAYILFKHNGIVENLPYTSENLEMVKSSFIVSKSKDGKLVIPCTTCDNCYASKRLKVAHVDFDTIENYPFIEHGFEVCDDKGEVIRLYIDKCSDYVIDHPRSKIVPTVLKEVRIKEFAFGNSDVKTLIKK